MEKLWMEEIVEALSKAFPEARIGTERVRQGFKAPCFLLRTEKRRQKATTSFSKPWKRRILRLLLFPRRTKA